MDEYCEEQQETDDADFAGHRVSSAVSHEFSTAVALPYVMYDDKCQGRNSAWSLVGGAYGHLLAMLQHNATVQVQQDLVASGVTKAPAEVLLVLEAPKPTSAVSSILFECAMADRLIPLPADKLEEATQMVNACLDFRDYAELGRKLMDLASSSPQPKVERLSSEKRARQALRAVS
jgi:hypothetical protein